MRIASFAALLALAGCSAIFPAPMLTVDAEMLVSVPPETVRPALDEALRGAGGASFGVYLTPYRSDGIDGAQLRLVRSARADVRGVSPVEILMAVASTLRDADASVGVAYRPRWLDADSGGAGCPAADAASFVRGSAEGTGPVLRSGVDGFQLDLAYPNDERIAGIEGVVVLSTLVEPDGRPTCVFAIQAPSPGLAAEAAQALRRQTFVPGSAGDVVVKTRFLVPVRFVLN